MVDKCIIFFHNHTFMMFICLYRKDEGKVHKAKPYPLDTSLKLTYVSRQNGVC